MVDFKQGIIIKCLTLVAVAYSPMLLASEDRPGVDYLSFAQGAIPVLIEEEAQTLKIGMDQALQAIDGNAGGFGLTPKPGTEDTKISLIYELPARTIFSEFFVPNVFETPSPSQTFVRTVEIAGSDQGPTGPFELLGRTALKPHSEKGQKSVFAATAKKPVRWVRLTLGGGLDVQREKTFFEFTEIVGRGSQERVPLLKAFSGQWKGRGVVLELKQEGARVQGCYDREGELTGTVEGNLLRATGQAAGIPSTFVLTVTDEGRVLGVRSTNGAPFRINAGDPAPGLNTGCSEKEVPSLGCGSTVHGINFDFDSADIRPESRGLLDDLSRGLKAEQSLGITVIGHTSSEGTEEYNEELSRRRAEAVVKALVARGVVEAKISAQGQGEKHPIADNDTDAGRSLNRRVEIACR